jgi:hypothetical protein
MARTPSLLKYIKYEKKRNKNDDDDDDING